MKRNMIATAAKAKKSIPERYDITVGELQELYSILADESRDGRWDALTTAFEYGFVLGARAQKAGKLQKRTTTHTSKKQTYIEMINRAAKECTDLDTLDLVYKILANGTQK